MQQMASAWDTDEIALDPTRLTLVCGTAGYDGTAFKGLLADRYDIQLNKTSRNSILLQTNINNTRSDVAHLIRVLAEIAHDIDTQLRRGGEPARLEFDEARRSADEGCAGPAQFQQLPGGVPRERQQRDQRGPYARSVLCRLPRGKLRVPRGGFAGDGPAPRSRGRKWWPRIS